MENKYDLKYKYELQCQYDSAKSFYRKAYYYKWLVNNDFIDIELYSYDTRVLYIRENIAKSEFLVRVNGGYNDSFLTVTTCRHIREMLRQVIYYCQNDFTRKQLREMNGKYVKLDAYGNIIGEVEIE